MQLLKSPIKRRNPQPRLLGASLVEYLIIIPMILMSVGAVAHFGSEIQAGKFIELGQQLLGLDGENGSDSGSTTGNNSTSGATDNGATDNGSNDGGTADNGAADNGETTSGSDSGRSDNGSSTDTGSSDSSAGASDVGGSDSGSTDGGAGTTDTGSDNGGTDTGSTDGDGSGENDDEALECEESDDASGGDGNDSLEEDRGFFGQIWNTVKDSLGAAYNFVRGFWDGMRNQVADLTHMITNPVETAEGLIALGKAFLDDPPGTLAAIGESIGKDLSRLINCGAYDRGSIIGENINPVFMLKLAGKLAKFDGDLLKAIRETKKDLGDLVDCASFVAGTTVWTPDNMVPIELIDTNQFVFSRHDETFETRPQLVANVFSRPADAYYRLETENGKISLTGEHPVWRQGEGWVKASRIKRGDVLATANGDTVVLGNNKIEKSVTVHNFSVGNTPNYFVGNERLWVHNATCRLPWTQAIHGLDDVVLDTIDPNDLFKGPSGDSLRDNLIKRYPELEKYGKPPSIDAEWQAHHIIPNNLEHPLLDSLNFDKDSVHNAIPLPKDRGAASTPHVGRHKRVYDEAIQDFLDELQELDLPPDVKKNAIVDGIENLRKAFAERNVELNRDPDLVQKQFDDILAPALEIARSQVGNS